MIVRTLLVAATVSCMCLVGCGGNDKKDGAEKDSNAKKDSIEKQPGADQEVAEKPKPDDTPESSAPSKPFVADEWAPAAGEENPDAWKPAESKTGGSIFSALKNAVVGNGAEEKP